jgi:hypothetical protein
LKYSKARGDGEDYAHNRRRLTDRLALSSLGKATMIATRFYILHLIIT